MKQKIFNLTSASLSIVYDTIAHTPHDNTFQVVIRPAKDKRSLAINKLYWLHLGEISRSYEESHGETFAPDTFHQYFKRLFLGQEAVEINGNQFVKMKSTTKLSNKGMVEYMERIELWAGDNLELTLSQPDDLYFDAMQK